MSKLLITHGFVKKLASNIRGSYGKEVRHTQVIELIADALGRKAGPMMHALKHEQTHNDIAEEAIPHSRIPFTEPATIDGLADAIRTNSPDTLSIFSRLLDEEDAVKELLASLEKEDIIPGRKQEGSNFIHPLTPSEWMKSNGIATDLDDEVERASFEAQLGRRWRNLQSATRCGAAVLILLALANLRTTDADGNNVSAIERDRLNNAATKEEAVVLQQALIDRFSQNRWIVATVQEFGKKHAYENTVIHAMMHRLIECGIVIDVATMEFVRHLDVSMWYGIANVGRQTFHTGGAGIVSHFSAERVMEKPLVDPWVDAACAGLDDYRIQKARSH